MTFLKAIADKGGKSVHSELVVTAFKDEQERIINSALNMAGKAKSHTEVIPSQLDVTIKNLNF